VLEAWDREQGEYVAIKVVRSDDKNKYFSAAQIEARDVRRAGRLRSVGAGGNSALAR
jgi:hypothetical protein